MGGSTTTSGSKITRQLPATGTRKLVAECFAANDDRTSYSLTVDDLRILFVEFPKTYCRRRAGTPTLANVGEPLQYPVAQLGTVPVRDFRPRELKSVLEPMIADGLVLSFIRVTHAIESSNTSASSFFL